MKTLKRSFAICLASLVVSQSSLAEPTLEQCVVACNEALDAADTHIESLSVELKTVRELSELKGEEIQLLKVRISDQEKELNAWYRNPLVIGLTGAIVGGWLLKGR